MAVKFQIEWIGKIIGRGKYLLAKILDKNKDFWLTDESKLGGYLIEKSISQPRAKDKNGNIRTDLYAFHLKGNINLEEIREGQIVELIPGDEIVYLEPWESIDENSHVFEQELQKELQKSHILFGEHLRAIGRRVDNDDYLFEIIETKKLAVVHLTWNGKNEETSLYPLTEIYNHWTDVFEKRILQDNKDFNL